MRWNTGLKPILKLLGKEHSFSWFRFRNLALVTGGRGEVASKHPKVKGSQLPHAGNKPVRH